MKPILFNTNMVQALLAGRKTVTRRVIRFPPGLTGSHQVGEAGNSDKPLGLMWACGIKRPPYQPGNILYVRETWAEWIGGMYAYKAHCFASEKYFDREGNEIHFKWHPSIHMPKDAARIFLRVKDVKVERLQDIDDAGAEKEGLRYWDDICRDETWHPTFYDPDSGGSPSVVDGFSRLWDSTIKPADITRYGWAANPWVWVIEFEQISREEAIA